MKKFSISEQEKKEIEVLYGIIQEQSLKVTYVGDNGKKLVDILDNARSLSWDDGIKKTLFNNRNDVIEFGEAIVSWAKKNNYEPLLLKAAVTLIFRESKGSPVVQLMPKELLGRFSNLVGGLPGEKSDTKADHSQGYAQIKPSTAKRYNIDMDSVYTYYGSFDAIYKMLLINYTNAKKLYTGGEVQIFDTKKNLVKIPALGNNAAVHMAIAAHNAGEGIINSWCETNIKGIANLCKIKSRKPFKDSNPKLVAVTNDSKKIQNYFPNVGGVHGYMPQIKSCFDALSELPNIIQNIKNMK